MPFSTREKRSQWGRDYYQRERDRVLEIKQRWIDKNPEKRKAHVTLNNAVRDGRVQRTSCEVCGAEKVHAHHADYSKPLEVSWLCPIHHRAVHG